MEVRNSVLVKAHYKATQHTLIAAVLSFECFDESRWCLEVQHGVVPRTLLLDGVRKFAQPPVVFVDNLRTVVGKQFFEFGYCVLCLVFRQNGIQDEHSFVIVQLHGLDLKNDVIKNRGAKIRGCFEIAKYFFDICTHEKK